MTFHRMSSDEFSGDRMDMKKKFGKVAVLLGGLSAEREISLKSGRAVLEGLLIRGVDAHAVDVGRDIASVLSRGEFDRAFNILHGPGGEDGSMQALLEFLNIPYCGSGVAASALAMDKVRTKWVWQANRLPTPDFMLIESEVDLNKISERFTFPVAIKPVHEGSSVGMSKVKSADELKAAYEFAKKYNDEVMVEQWIIGSEYTVTMIADEAYPSIKIETPREFYDYTAKYLEKTTIYSCPSGLSEVQEKEIQQLAKKAFKALGCHGWGRVDFMCDKASQFWLIEINTLPGMTETSFVPKAARAKGVEFP